MGIHTLVFEICTLKAILYSVTENKCFAKESNTYIYVNMFVSSSLLNTAKYKPGRKTEITGLKCIVVRYIANILDNGSNIE